MRPPLVEREAALIKDLGPSAEAKRLAAKLIEQAEEVELRAKLMAEGSAAQELLHLDAQRLRRAAELLRILEQEQWRQREAIGLYLYGQIDRVDLRKYRNTWNGTALSTSETR